MDATYESLPRASTGTAGLDHILGSGLARNRLHLLEGSPGTGKTTIALQFLRAGAELGEAGIYISLAETEEELRDGARSHGWTLSDLIEICELVPPESVLDPDQHQSLLYSSDLELGETTTAHLRRDRADQTEAGGNRQPVRDQAAGAEFATLSPADSRAEALLRAASVYGRHARRSHDRDHRSRSSQYRAQRDPSGSACADLWRRAPPAAGRQMPRADRSGAAIMISSSAPGGVKVFPRLVAAEHRTGFTGATSAKRHSASSTTSWAAGIAADRARSFIGPAGTGKSLLLLQYVAAAAARGERAALFVFDEELGLLIERAKGAGHRYRRHVRLPASCSSSRLDAAELSPGEFSHRVRAVSTRRRRRSYCRHRQLERLSGCDAGRAVSDPAPARTASVSEPARRRDVPDASRSTAWSAT